MPCTDGGASYPLSREERLDALAPAMLCAVLNTMYREAYEAMLQRIDWKEAGVSKSDFFAWKQMHDDLDRKRKADEERRTLQEGRRAKALGLKGD